jgi:hypothetical protein
MLLKKDWAMDMDSYGVYYGRYLGNIGRVW